MCVRPQVQAPRRQRQPWVSKCRRPEIIWWLPSASAARGAPTALPYALCDTRRGTTLNGFQFQLLHYYRKSSCLVIAMYIQFKSYFNYISSGQLWSATYYCCLEFQLLYVGRRRWPCAWVPPPALLIRIVVTRMLWHTMLTKVQSADSDAPDAECPCTGYRAHYMPTVTFRPRPWNLWPLNALQNLDTEVANVNSLPIFWK